MSNCPNGCMNGKEVLKDGRLKICDVCMGLAYVDPYKFCDCGYTATFEHVTAPGKLFCGREICLRKLVGK
jgi:hypothetical protein